MTTTATTPTPPPITTTTTKTTTTTTTTTTTPTTTVLPFCKEDDDSVIGSFDLRSSSDDELSASSKNCIPMPDCPKEGENSIDLRSPLPGVNCKPVAKTTQTTEIISTTTVLPFCKEDDDIFIGSFDLRSSSDDE